MPALNEESCIGQTIKQVPRDVVDEIVVVDGHSKDNTINEAREALRDHDTIITQTQPGFGSALYEGVEVARGDIIIIMDADGSQNPQDIPRLLEHYRSGTVVMASRYATGGKSDDDTLIRWTGNWLFTKLTNLLHDIHTTDSLYFFFAIARTDFIKLNLQAEGYRICIEFLVKAKLLGLHFKEIPAIERPRIAGESKVNALRDGFKILGAILRRYSIHE